MPYTKRDYPDSMKNLDKIVRVKAIDILNAMLKNGYDEGQAIPISISQAKEWAADASDEEKKALSKEDITKHQKTSDSARLQNADVRVSYDQEKEKWSVESEGAKQVDSYYETKKEAVTRAKEIADNRGTSVIKEKKNN